MRTHRSATASGSASGFLGREPELAALSECAELAQAGAPWLVVVEGEAGIGKTALVRRALEELNGFTTWWATCDLSEQDWPFGLVEQWRRRAVPALVKDLAVLGGGLGPSVAPVSVGEDLLSLVGAVQKTGPVALVLDDVQWADAESLKVLRFVLRRLWADRVLVIATCRTGLRSGVAVETAEDWRRLIAGAAHSRVLRLEGLTESHVAQLAAEARGPLTSAAARRLWKHTGGHPLYLRSILSVTPHDRLSDLLVDLPVPGSVVATVDSSLEGLPPSSLALVEALAVLNTRVPLPLAGQVAAVDDPPLALGPLLESGLVIWQPTEPSSPVGITHPLQRDAIYQAIRPQRRRELHAAAAPAVDADAAWAHLVAAADRTDAALADALESEAAKRAKNGSSDRAATLLLWAADLSETRILHERRLLTAAMYTSSLFNPPGVEVARSLRRAVEGCAPSARRTHLQGCYAYGDGHYQEAARLSEKASAEAEAEGDHTTLDQARIRLGLSSFQAGAPERAIALIRQVLGGCTSPTERAGPCMLLGVFLLLADGPSAVLQEPWVAALPSDPARAEIADTLLLLARGYSRFASGEPQAARRDFTTALVRSRAGAVPLLTRAQAEFNLAACQYMLGDWDQTLEQAEQAVTEGEIGGRLTYSSAAHAWAVFAAAGRGQWQRARQHLDACRSHTPMPVLADLPGLAEAAIAQAHGDPAAMLRALQPLHAGAVHLPRATWPNLQFWPMWTEALTATSRLEQARDALDHLQSQALEAPCLRIIAALSAGQLAEAQGDSDAAAAMYHEVLDQAPTPDDPPLHCARLEHAAGRLHGAVGDSHLAAQLLRRARQRYTDLGAKPFLDRLDRERPTSVAAPPIAEPVVIDGLTEREQAIAGLAAQGLTNQEIARRLYISTKTVEYHLSHVYTKLALTSRRQLGAALSRSDDGRTRLQGSAPPGPPRSTAWSSWPVG